MCTLFKSIILFSLKKDWIKKFFGKKLSFFIPDCRCRSRRFDLCPGALWWSSWFDGNFHQKRCGHSNPRSWSTGRKGARGVIKIYWKPHCIRCCLFCCILIFFSWIILELLLLPTLHVRWFQPIDKNPLELNKGHWGILYKMQGYSGQYFTI